MVKDKNSITPSQVECLTALPLNQFALGQLLYVKWNISNGHPGFALAQFESIDRGNVKVKLVKGHYLWPDYLRWDHLEHTFPELRMRVRPTSLYIWCKRPGKDRWPCAHWFKDTKTPAI